MKTKKIVADSIPLALKMVRQQLGDNAIIVNTRAIKSGGLFGFFAKQKFEVTAYSMDQDPPQAARNVSMDMENEKPLIESTSKTAVKPIEETNFSDEQKRKIINDVLVKRSIHHTNLEGVNSKGINESDNNGLPAANQSQSSEATGSGFHKKPQMLYQYYSQNADSEKEKTVAPPKAKPAEPDHLLDELKSLKNMMMVFMTGEKQGNGPTARFAKWINRLKQQGVTESVLEAIVIQTVNAMIEKFGSLNAATDEAIEQEMISIVQGMIERRTPKSNVLPEDVRLINIIGPTGVGKTTTIAKLATEQILKQKRQVAMITTDVYRIAAVEQLKTYAGILNVPIEVARSREELDQVLMKLKHFDLIYMDTTGRNFKDEKNRESINEFLHHPLISDNYLALSLTTKYEDLQYLLNEFLESPVNKLILTKLDETSSYGSILNIAYHYPYEITYLTNGQSVPEDITTIDPAMLANSLVGDER
ncbi:flagellar biosynthesis protein FlhF [Neobacillus sp. OS1-32]|uniref:Flagellar biosynthesis protein FlhF n=1 Tax=Neobacillus paridis TaxID=2803862 RepID=A0ABS1TRR1_9BACI|nr:MULTISPECIES: flagellar biosynthesis protein FlhF [Neobacillus]MBL4952961.1 flagellar biosynthesis protein FlhF [Neobacillus paridis]WML31518.1 flagellar biosynthesis protein FlhF [Neobacillus sp. OS1-32]